MIEILGGNLEKFFNKDIIGKCTYKGNIYEVWEISDETFNIMRDMSEAKFIELAGEDAFWRSSLGSNQGSPDAKYTINGKEIFAWDGCYRFNFYKDNCIDCEDRMDGMCEALDTDIDVCYKERKYNTLLDYLCNEMGASQPRNVCALAVDLAKYNNITIGELFTKYES